MSKLTDNTSGLQTILESLQNKAAGGSSFPYTATFNSNLGLTANIFYDYINSEILVMYRSAVGAGVTDITGGVCIYSDITYDRVFLHIGSITDNVIINVTHNMHDI